MWLRHWFKRLLSDRHAESWVVMALTRWVRWWTFALGFRRRSSRGMSVIGIIAVWFDLALKVR